jgi:hypothetical protein
MRLLRHILVLLLFLTALISCAFAQEQKRTDAQVDDLAGPVKSVSVTSTHTGIRWEQPGGPTLVVPVWCGECEYDADGNKTKSGQIFDGRFLGETIRLVRDANGRVTDRYAENASTGEKFRHEVVGPFGNTEQTYYRNGEPYSRQTFSYDQYGNVTEFITFDSSGKQEARVHAETDKDGTLREKWAMGKDGQINWLQTFDAKTKVERWTSFNEFGDVNVTWAVGDGKLISFWKSPGSPPHYGDNFTEDAENDTWDNYDCHDERKCELFHIHREYLDPKRRNPQSAEWRDSDGNLRYAAYYEYEIDAFRNWTHRKVWVWTPALGERTLLETDSRTISYWQK